jgi:hypothetical protein
MIASGFGSATMILKENDFQRIESNISSSLEPNEDIIENEI